MKIEYTLIKKEKNTGARLGKSKPTMEHLIHQCLCQ